VLRSVVFRYRAWVRTVVRINVTPVKGTTLHHPERVELTPTGIPQNRRFFLVDARGELFGAPDLGPLVRIVASYSPEAERLRVSFPGADVEGPADDLDERIMVDFYGRPVPGAVVAGPFAEALSTFADRPLRLVRAAQDGDGSDDGGRRQERQENRRRTDRSRPHGSRLGAHAARHKAPTEGLSVVRTRAS